MERYFLYNNSKVVYTSIGEGETVVLLHGFGEDKEIFNNQLQLKEYCRVIIPDLPGSGASSILAKEDTSLEDYADCIYSLLQSEDITHCLMLGHSMGGYITLAFAKKYPQLLKGFGLIHSTAFADSAEKKEARRKGMELIEEYGSYSFLKNTIPTLFSATFKKDFPEQVTALIEKGAQFSKEALIQYYGAMMNRPDSTEVLKHSTVPVLFIMGTEDVAAPLNDLLQQVHLPQIAQINVLENVGHMGMLEKPEAINRHLLHFISTLGN